MRVKNEIKTYEVEGDREANQITIEVTSHWNRNKFVVLSVTGGPIVTVLARELQAAISNATNSA